MPSAPSSEAKSLALQGAVSLLTAAAKLSVSGATESPEILDHLADALWRIGRTDRASESWRRARTNLRQLLENPNRSQPQQESIDTLLSNVERKLDAVDDARVPPLAPMLKGGFLPRISLFVMLKSWG